MASFFAERRPILGLAAILFALAGGGVASGACADPTQITTIVSTDIPHAEGRSVGIWASRPGGDDSEPAAALADIAWGADGEIGSIVVAPQGDREAPVAIRVVMGISKPVEQCSIASPEGCVVARRRLRFISGRPLRLPVRLYAACQGIPCSANETCNALGQCVSAEVDLTTCDTPEGCQIPGDPISPSTNGVDGGAQDAGVDGSAGPKPLRATAVACGDAHACALIERGRVKCWGFNTPGTLGIGDKVDRGSGPNQMGNGLPFVALGTGRTAIELAAGTHFTCARLDNGDVKCWGSGNRGRLGSGSTTPVGTTPAQMGDGLPKVELGAGRTAKQITAGGTHACALLDDDTVKCWGGNDRGQLGVGDVLDRGAAPGEMGDALPRVDLGPGRTAKLVAAGELHTCAILDNDSLKCWGDNTRGQLGQANTTPLGVAAGDIAAAESVDLGPGLGAVRIAAGIEHTCALRTNNTLVCFGGGLDGQLGIGASIIVGDGPGEMGELLVVADLGLPGLFTPFARHDQSCALWATGELKCWGANDGGQLGQGDLNSRGGSPGQMGAALPTIDLGTRNGLVALGMGRHFSCAVLQNGSVKCWGENESGQLGLGDTLTRGDGPGEMGQALELVNLGKE